MSDNPTGTGPLPGPSKPSSGEVPMSSGGSEATERRADGFVSALPTTSGRRARSDTYARLGMAAMVLGLVAAVFAAVLSQLSSNPLDQSTQISLGIAGLAVTCFGGVVFLRYSMGDLLRYWLLRVLADRHRDDPDPEQR